MKSLAALFLIAFSLSYLLVPWTRQLFIRFGKLDLPDPRKLHKVAVPRSGGLALMSAYLIAVGAILLLPAGGNYILDRYSGFLSRLLPAVAIVCLTGLFDDLFNLQARYKLTGQFAAATFAYWAGIRLFDTPPGYEWLSFAATAFWLILCSNAFNLTDGTDGLAGTLGVLSCLGLISVALALDYYSLAFVFTPLLGATLPFLRANWPPASLFLGDTGSLTLGFLIGCGGAALARRFPAGEGLTAAILILTLPLMEVALSSARRLLRGQSIFLADSFHIHHQLKRQGHDDASVLWRLSRLSLIATVIAVAQIWLRPLERVLLIVPFLAYLGLKVSRLRYPEFNVLSEAIVGGRIRNWLRHQILLRALEDELCTIEECSKCAALLEVHARQLGLKGLDIRFPGHELQHPIGSHDTEPTYAVRIDLPGHNWVNFKVPVHLKRTENPASDFAAVILRNFSAQRLESFRLAAAAPVRQPEATPV
jgi:UDP-GlcNAc:undecaprenyl-phosphate GlcNAc-1-phosphate transferase